MYLPKEFVFTPKKQKSQLDSLAKNPSAKQVMKLSTNKLNTKPGVKPGAGKGAANKSVVSKSLTVKQKKKAVVQKQADKSYDFASSDDSDEGESLASIKARSPKKSPTKKSLQNGTSATNNKSAATKASSKKTVSPVKKVAGSIIKKAKNIKKLSTSPTKKTPTSPAKKSLAVAKKQNTKEQYPPLSPVKSKSSLAVVNKKSPKKKATKPSVPDGMILTPVKSYLTSRFDSPIVAHEEQHSTEETPEEESANTTTDSPLKKYPKRVRVTPQKHSLTASPSSVATLSPLYRPQKGIAKIPVSKQQLKMDSFFTKKQPDQEEKPAKRLKTNSPLEEEPVDQEDIIMSVSDLSQSQSKTLTQGSSTDHQADDTPQGSYQESILSTQSVPKLNVRRKKRK